MKTKFIIILFLFVSSNGFSQNLKSVLNLSDIIGKEMNIIKLNGLISDDILMKRAGNRDPDGLIYALNLYKAGLITNYLQGTITKQLVELFVKDYITAIILQKRKLEKTHLSVTEKTAYSSMLIEEKKVISKLIQRYK